MRASPLHLPHGRSAPRRVTSRVARLALGAGLRSVILLGLLGLGAAGCGDDLRDPRDPRDPRVPRGAPAEAHEEPATVTAPRRIVALGGPITETLFALGAGERLVGADLSSLYPAAATELPRVGYYRQFSAEGVLSLRPDLVIASADAGPAAAIDHLRAAGIRVETIAAAHDLAAAEATITAIAELAGITAADLTRVRRKLARDLAAAEALRRQVRSRPRVLFVYARGPGRLLVGGEGTAIAELLRLAEADNAAAAHQGMRPWSAEAVIDAAPEVVLLPTRGLDSLGGVAGLLELPGLAETPAGRARRVVAIDDLKLLGFGPRVGEGLRELLIALHPELAAADAGEEAAP